MSTTVSGWSLSDNISQTLDPCVVLMKQIVSQHQGKWAHKGGIYSLAQGVVYWPPPRQALNVLSNIAAKNIDEIEQNKFHENDLNVDDHLTIPSQAEIKVIHQYCPDEGLPQLVDALKDKLHQQNHMHIPKDDMGIFVTSGANQAYVNCILTFLSHGDQCIIFKPYYFNHVMAIQMCRGTDSIVFGPLIEDTGIPDIEWLKRTLQEQQDTNDSYVTQAKRSGRKSIRMVTLVNPGNPTGVSIPYATLQTIIEICKLYKVWLVMDNTYEHFDHIQANQCNSTQSCSDDEYNKNILLNPAGLDSMEITSQRPFTHQPTFLNSSHPVDHVTSTFPCSIEPHVIHIFSFSKGYAMAGYRVGYIVMSLTAEESQNAYKQMLKVQDTIPICAPRLSQWVALGSLSAGRHWVSEKVASLDRGRKAVLKALECLPKTIGGSGAMYVLGKLPDGLDDIKIATILVEQYGVAVIPASFCGYPGWIRVSYSNLEPEQCVIAAGRLADGLQQLCKG